jgi:hypothetical protein
MIDLDAIRGRWSAAHEDDEQINRLGRREACAALVEAVDDIDELVRELEGLRADVAILRAEPAAAMARVRPTP